MGAALLADDRWAATPAGGVCRLYNAFLERDAMRPLLPSNKSETSPVFLRSVDLARRR
jgi:hypothetical protein